MAGTRNALKHVVSTGSWLAIGAAVLALVGLAAIMVVPRALGWHGVIVLSGSMEPALKTGGIVFYQPVKDPSAIEVGDIITFTTPSGLGDKLTHRVVEVIPGPDGLSFRTKGDANSSPDVELAEPSRLLGVAKFDVPYLGRLVDFLRHRDNFYLIVGIPALLLIISELGVITGELRAVRAAKTSSAGQPGSEAGPQ
jgi:signal peptidase